MALTSKAVAFVKPGEVRDGVSSAGIPPQLPAVVAHDDRRYRPGNPACIADRPEQDVPGGSSRTGRSRRIVRNCSRQTIIPTGLRKYRGLRIPGLQKYIAWGLQHSRMVLLELDYRHRCDRINILKKICPGVGPRYPQVVVLVGATGDLSRRKLLPGLFHLSSAGFIPGCRIIGVSLDDLDADGFRRICTRGA